ncbi:hypothetical protein FRC12_016762 [Ceratobasidium sp. 428]|nr:hypothetical protein FRC12_016762 [Ceratobasidium sp. 428]
MHEQNRIFQVMYPGFETDIELAWYDAQIRGSNLIVRNARKLADGTTGGLADSFVNTELGTFCVRSPVFASQPADDEDTQASLLTNKHELLPQGYRYPTWNFDSPTVHEVFTRTIARGYEPQLLEAYNRFNHLIHPNKVSGVLSGAIVMVSCTLERALYFSRSQSFPEWRLYANLVKVRVLQPRPHLDSVLTTKRKHSVGYGPGGSWSIPEERSPKKKKTVEFETDSAN